MNYLTEGNACQKVKDHGSFDVILTNLDDVRDVNSRFVVLVLLAEAEQKVNVEEELD